MQNIRHIDIKQTTTNSDQHCHSGQALYITKPIGKNRLPTAVAPSQRP